MFEHIRPAHGEISRELADRIQSGRYEVGSLLPTEFELCEQFGASRHSVRRALQSLQDLGLISRRKNVGTRVESRQPAPGFIQSVATVDELAQYGAAHGRTMRRIDRVTADAALAMQLGCARGTKWLRFSSVRREGGPRSRPIGWSDVYVDPVFDGIADRVRESPQVLISALIETHYGRRIQRILQDIHATVVPPGLADELAADAGSPALRIVRRYLDERDQAFEVSVTIHPADRFTFSTVLNRSRHEPAAS